MNKKYLSTHAELEIHSWGNGVQLREIPTRKDTFFVQEKEINIPTIQDIFQLPFSVYFLNTRSELQNSNSVSPDLLGVSLTKLLGKTLLEVIGNQGNQELRHDQVTMQSKQSCFFNEIFCNSPGIRSIIF